MSLSPDEAAHSLREVNAMHQRSRESYSYRIGSSYFLIWGSVWLIGYGAFDLLRDVRAIWLWDGLTIIGIAASVWVSFYNARVHGAASGWRHGVQFAIIFAYCAAASLVLWPMRGDQIAAFIPLLWAAIYASFGVWMGARYMIVGAVLTAATLGGFFLLHQHFALWMAIVGGGAMILTGFWLRQA